MATDFFDRQDHARRQTFRLLVLFAVAVIVIIVAIYLVVAVLFEGAVEQAARHGGRPAAPHLWDPVLFGWVAVGTLMVIGLASLFKISQLAAGGETVALMLGGRAVDPQTRDLAERRLMNVVEEMALASGIPVPPVYVLENEPGINAFAAGHRPGDAVVAVSRGCLEYLTREEIQGVIAHEFSHILNGDMRLNLRLIGIVYGILILAIIGYYVMRSASAFSSRDEKNKGGAAAATFFLGLALIILGYLGVLLGKIIKSAISRQREFLADASAVQFTRYPGGIAGALKKIGGLTEGSRIRDGHAEEISHMFFGDAFAGSFLNLFATHPPLAERIRRLEPDFDGGFPEVRQVAETEDAGAMPQAASRLAAVAAPVAALDAGSVMQSVGRPQTQHLRHAEHMVAAMPQTLADAAREPFAARAVVFALLLSREDETIRARQLQLIEEEVEPLAYRQAQQLAGAVGDLPPERRLPLVDMAVPALKRLSPQQYAQFREVVEALVTADGQMDLFEYCLRTVLFSYLDVQFGLKRPAAVRYRTIGAVVRPAAVVLSALAYAGQSRPDDVRRAFQAGASGLPAGAELLPAEECTFQAFDAALAELAQAAPKVQRSLMAAAVACIAADGTMTLKECELARTVAAALACPLPPVA